MGALLFLTYIVGEGVSMWVFMSRAGLGFLVVWGVPVGYRLRLFATNVQWLTTSFGKALVWPLVLTVWLVQGRPESPWTVVGKRHNVPVVRRVEEVPQEEKELEETPSRWRP